VITSTVIIIIIIIIIIIDIEISGHINMAKKETENISKYIYFLKFYCKESMNSMFKDKFQNCSLHQFEQIFKQ
jgi:hypothetical protein